MSSNPKKMTHKGTFTVWYKESIDGGYIGFLEELPGVMSQGETKDELINNVGDALLTMLAALKKEQDGQIEHTILTEGFIPMPVPAFA